MHDLVLAVGLALVVIVVVQAMYRVYTDVVLPQWREWRKARQQREDAFERMDNLIELNKHKRERK